MPSFLSHYSIPGLYRVYDAIVGALLKYFAPISVGRVQTPILQCDMANHFLCSFVVWLCLWYGPLVCN